MLEIGLVPKSSGSTGFGRFYPHEGYLGLSPVVVSGTIVSHLPPLCPTLPIRQVTISLRCIETRTVGTEVEGVLWERAKRLWEPSGESEYEELGDWSSPFQITVPKDAVAASAQWTRDLKVVWQLQVSFEHKPIPYVGNRIIKTYLVDIQSYASHPLPPPSPPSAIHLQGAEVFVNPPHGQFGPGETFTSSLHVKPEDPTTSIRRTTLILERHTISHGGGRRSQSPGYTKLEEPHVTKLVETTTDEAVPGSGGTYWVSISATVPKRGGRWQAGETGSTKLTSTTFECRLKISLKVKKSSKEIVTSIPIVLVACTSSERSSAQAIVKEAESHPKAALPRRKHRSSRRGLYMHEGTVDISDPIVHGRSRRRHKTTPVSPILAVSPTHTEGVKPILLSSPVPQPQSISFAPSLPITTLIHPPTPSTPSAPAFSPLDQPQDEYPDSSPRRQYQSTGRRISTTTSEEEEIQPSRNRMRLDDLMFPMPPSTIPQSHSQSNTYRDDPPRDRPSLPSLDVLGLGLPPVPEYDRPPTRPRTAPAHSSFPTLGSRPGSSAGVPPPLSGSLAVSPQKGLGLRPVTSGYGRARREDEGAFAFGMARR